MSQAEMILIGLAAAIGLAALVFWVTMIRDCWINTAPGSRERYAWLIVVVLGKLVGAVAYYLLKKRPAVAAVEVADGNGADGLP